MGGKRRLKSKNPRMHPPANEKKRRSSTQVLNAKNVRERLAQNELEARDELGLVKI